MTKFACGCESDGVILMSNDTVDMSVYLDWQVEQLEGDRELCWYCWQEKNNIRTKSHCGYVAGKWKNKSK